MLSLVETFKFITLYEGIYLFQVQRSLFVLSLNVNFASWLHHLEFRCFQMNFLSFVFKLFHFEVLSFFFICNQIVFLLLLCAFTTRCYCCSICMHLQPSLVSTLLVCICNQILLVFLYAFAINFDFVRLQLSFIDVLVACICD